MKVDFILGRKGWKHVLVFPSAKDAFEYYDNRKLERFKNIIIFYVARFKDERFAIFCSRQFNFN